LSPKNLAAIGFLTNTPQVNRTALIPLYFSITGFFFVMLMSVPVAEEMH
jgi:hypothetical protein